MPIRWRSALTTRLFDHVSGTQYLSATIGQIRYFSIPRVGLPDGRCRADGVRRLVTIPGSIRWRCPARRWSTRAARS